MSENIKVAKAAGVVGAATLASRIMGYVRDMVMSWAFGTTAAADAFYVAYRIPNLLRELLAEGSMSAAFIPVFTETLTKGSKDEAKRLANAVLARLLVILVIATVLGIIFAPYIVKLMALGWKFRDHREKFLLAASLTRMMFPYLLFIGLAALAMGMLNSLRSFLFPALSPVMLNIMTISSVFLLSPRMPEPIMGAAVGVVLGGLMQFLIQIPALKRQGMMLTPRFTPSHPGVKKVGALALPVFFSSSISQINIFLGTIFASFLATGSIAYLFYGMRFIHFPLGIFGIAIATAVLPTLSAQAAKQEMDNFRDTLSLGIRLVFFIMFPAMAGLIMLRVPIINLLLEHGEFNRISTLGVSAALMYYAMGLWALAGVRVVSQAFYSLQDTRTPVRIAILALVANIVLSVLLIQTPLQHGGLALANSLAAALNITLLAKRLRKKIGRMDGRRIALSLTKIVPASVVMGLIGWWVARNPLWESPGNTLIKIQWLGGAMAVSILFYIVAMWAMRSEELTFLWGMVRRKGRRGDGETR
jgi:putative peptidoglycan lipid II flippase